MPFLVSAPPEQDTHYLYSLRAIRDYSWACAPIIRGLFTGQKSISSTGNSQHFVRVPWKKTSKRQHQVYSTLYCCVFCSRFHLLSCSSSFLFYLNCTFESPKFRSYVEKFCRSTPMKWNRLRLRPRQPAIPISASDKLQQLNRVPPVFSLRS